MDCGLTLMKEFVSLTRGCEAIQIPSGNSFLLPAGTRVRVTQSLGGTYTVITEEGYMVRIAGKDADALGQNVGAGFPRPKGEETSPLPTDSVDPAEIEKRVWAQLSTVFDPEIPVNVVDLGLVYLCKVTPSPEGGHKVEVKMTLTAPGCGMGSVLKADAENKIRGIPGVNAANVEMVVDPPWNPGRMSEAAKLQLGMF